MRDQEGQLERYPHQIVQTQKPLPQHKEFAAVWKLTQQFYKVDMGRLQECRKYQEMRWSQSKTHAKRPGPWLVQKNGDRSSTKLALKGRNAGVMNINMCFDRLQI